MISHVLPSFKKNFRDLPKEINVQAKSTYKRWKINPFLKSLEFKQVHQTSSSNKAYIFSENWFKLACIEHKKTEKTLQLGFG